MRTLALLAIGPWIGLAGHDHPDAAPRVGPAVRFADVARGGARTPGLAAVEACAEGLEDLPGEHGAMLASAQIEAGQLPAAVAMSLSFRRCAWCST